MAEAGQSDGGPAPTRASRLSIAFARAGAVAPRAALRVTLSAALGDLDVALCLHRVGRAAASVEQPDHTIPPEELDALVELLLASRPRSSRRWLTLTFDDGYEDAADYIATRATRYPEAGFLFFVCPEKLEARAGFRWDAVQLAIRRGASYADAARAVDLPLDLDAENRRADLREVAEQAQFRLAGADALRALASHPNVTLGNHTNCHFPAAELDAGRWEVEVARSDSDFTRLFGPARDFAFPFGVPGRHFSRRDVDVLRRAGGQVIWSTESRPHAPSERAPGAVVPRFVVLGYWSHRSLAGFIAGRAAVFRARGTGHVFDVPRGERPA